VPPNSPKYGCVEGSHRTLREEFYDRYQNEYKLQAVNQTLDIFQHQYCHYRPHSGKGRHFFSSMEYYQSLAEAALCSYVLSL